MQPILASFSLGDGTVTLRAYSTFLLLAALVALALAARGAVRLGVPRRKALAGFGLAIVAGLAGARLLDVALNASAYAEDPGRIAALEFRGFALFGGLAVGMLVAVVAARAWRVSGWALADSAIPAVAAGIVLMRIGCFLNGCCAGMPTDLPWGIVFPSGGAGLDWQILDSIGLVSLSDESVPVHPTQLYEAVAAILCCGVALWLRARGVPPGTPALAFAAGFLLFRAGNQLLRAPSPAASVPEWVLPAIYLAAGVAIAGILARRWRTAGMLRTMNAATAGS